jgi:hypothetical protein
MKYIVLEELAWEAVRWAAGDPGLDCRIGLVRIERKQDVPDEEDASGPEHIRHAPERLDLPEVGEMVQGPLRENEVDRLAPVFVAEEALLHVVEVVQLQPLGFPPHRIQHRRRYVDANNSPADPRCLQGQGAGAAAEVDEDVFLRNAQVDQTAALDGRIDVRHPVVGRQLPLIGPAEVLELVE